MTARALTPTEQTEVSRFGAHDEEILRDLAEHADETIPCGWCRLTATWRLSMRCCGTNELMCQKHRDITRDAFAGHHPLAPVRCMHCGHRHPASTPYADVIREVQL
ncbi:hypothetical protein C1632_02595 [Microbacterium testaceum]|uniref:hypothetical protein n=1 Tax=Microbacterium testaceum TaxID=2033 RepID=UPI000CCF02FA|nr:hypothetical protein [Microbacterium testaceum]PNW10668.1 hypothetical protein C1632_02595 [Microbacterium testaceum]